MQSRRQGFYFFITSFYMALFKCIDIFARTHEYEKMPQVGLRRINQQNASCSYKYYQFFFASLFFSFRFLFAPLRNAFVQISPFQFVALLSSLSVPYVNNVECFIDRAASNSHTYTLIHTLHNRFAIPFLLLLRFMIERLGKVCVSNVLLYAHWYGQMLCVCECVNV